MNLARLLLQALVEVNGDALVLRNGDKPSIITPTGPVDLNGQSVAFTGTADDLLTELLPDDLQHALDHLGVIEHDLPSTLQFGGDHFTVVATRSRGDVSVEIRRHRIPDDDRIPQEFFDAGDGAAVGEIYPVYASTGSPEMPRGLAPKPVVVEPKAAVAEPTAAGTEPHHVARPRRGKSSGPAASASDLRALQREIKRMLPNRRNRQPEIQKSAVQLALTTLACLRRALKRQAMDRMRQKTLSRKQVDAIAGDLMRLEEIIGDLAAKFGLTPSDLKIDSE